MMADDLGTEPLTMTWNAMARARMAGTRPAMTIRGNGCATPIPGRLGTKVAMTTGRNGCDSPILGRLRTTLAMTLHG
jgi:hypothetical protein